MNRKFTFISIILILVCTIGCLSITSDATLLLKVDSNHIFIDKMGHIIKETTREGSLITEILVTLTQEEIEATGITEKTVIFDNVSIDNSLIDNIVAGLVSGSVQINITPEEQNAINSGLEKIENIVKPFDSLIIVNEIKPTSGNIGTLIPTPTIIITIDFPDGTKIIFYDTDGDGDADYFVVIFPNGTRITGYVGDFVDWNWLLNFIKERLGWN